MSTAFTVMPSGWSPKGWPGESRHPVGASFTGDVDEGDAHRHRPDRRIPQSRPRPGALRPWSDRSRRDLLLRRRRRGPHARRDRRLPAGQGPSPDRASLQLVARLRRVGLQRRRGAGGLAVDIALWDVLGKSLGQPLHALLGGRSRDQIRTYNTCAGERYGRGRRAQAVANWGLDEPGADGRHEDLDAFLHSPVELARSLLDEGTTAMKIWPFDPYAEATLGHYISGAELDRALEPIRHIRDAVGPEMDMMIELHALWDVPAACRIVSALAEFDLFWIEDPVRATSADAHAVVQRATRTPIAAGETLAGLADYRDLLARDGARILIFDVGWVGGITAARKAAAARGGIRATGSAPRLHRADRLHRGNAPVAAPTQRDPPGKRARVLGWLVQGVRHCAAGDRTRHGVHARRSRARPRAPPRGLRALRPPYPVNQRGETTMTTVRVMQEDWTADESGGFPTASSPTC